MNFLLGFALIFAVLEALALQKDRPRLEYVAKPAVMISLFTWLWMSVGLNRASFWFGLGILFSLAGDILLMISLDRLFLAGLVAFLLAHVAYIVGFNSPPSAISLWEGLMAIIIGLGAARIIRRIISPLAAKGQARLRMPIIIYSVVISIMLLSAMMKLTDVNWKSSAAVWVSAGAFLFYLSDIILAWSKFVFTIRNGRIYNIASYHLGQIALIAGVIRQFSV